MVLKASALRIFVNRFDESVVFYKDTLGLKLETVERGHAHFKIDNMNLLLEHIHPEEEEEHQEHVGRFLAVSLESKDIHAAYETLRRRGVRFSGPPRRTNWGGYMTHFYDLERNCLSLVQYPN